VRALLRTGLVVLAAVEVVLGAWTAPFPASSYADVPTVDLTPPFSEHLMRDFGGATLGLALVLGAAAVAMLGRPAQRGAATDARQRAASSGCPEPSNSVAAEASS